MRVSAGFAILLLAFLSRSVAPAEDQDKPDTVPPADTEPGDLDDGKSIQLALEAGMHTARATRLLFSPDGKQAITVSLDKTIRIWDLATGQTIRVLRPPSTTGSGQILDAALSWDGQLLAVQCYTPRGKLLGKDVKGLLYLIRLNDGQVLQTWPGAYHREWAALTFSPDGKRLVASEGASGKSAVRIYEIASGKPEKELDAQPPWVAAKLHSVAFSPDGQLLAGGAGGEHGLRVWSLTTGLLLHKVPLGDKDQYVPAVAWSPDGKLLAYCRSHGPVRVLQRDGETFKELWETKAAATGAGCRFLAFTPDGRQLFHAGHTAGATGRPVFLRDAQTGKVAQEGKGKERPLFTVPVEEHRLETGALSGDGRLLGFTGNKPQEIFVCKADGTSLQRLAGKAHPIARAAWAQDGPSIAWTDKKPAKGAKPVFRRSFNLAKLEFDAEIPANLQEPVLTRPELSLRMEGIRAELFKGEKKVAELGSRISFMTLLANDLAALVGGEDPISLFKTTTGKRVGGLNAHTSGVTSLAPSPDGRYLLSSGNDQILHIWDPAQAKPLKNQRMLPLLSLFFADEEWVAWTQEGYYAASPAGEKLIGWVTDSGPGKLMKFHPAQRFRQKLYKPEVIKLVLEKRSVEEARKAAKVEKQDIEKLLPPQGSLKPMQDGAKVTVETVVQVSGKTQPLTELHLLVDGRPAKLGNGEVAVKTFTPAAQKDVKESWTVTLEPGPHKLSVRAVAKDTYSISEEATVEVKPPMAVPRNNKQGTLYYLGIGVNQFKYEPGLKLTGAVPDIVAMEKCLKDTCKNRFVEIKPTVLTDDKATLPRILEALTELQKKLKPTDVVIVHYSSHGEVVEGGGLFLLCHDTKRNEMKTTAVPGEKLREILGQYPCPVLLILDACHSGKFPLMRPITDPLSRLLADDSCGVAVMTAALAHQVALENARGGVFTQALIQGLSGKADPDKVNKRLYVHHLFTYVFDAVARETLDKQMPLYLPSGSVPPIVLKD